MPIVTHSLRSGGAKIAADSPPSPIISSAAVGRPNHARNPAIASAPPHDENISRYVGPTTNVIHSHKTASAAAPQNSAKGQSPRYAVNSASGASTAAESTRRARLLADNVLVAPSEPETGSAPTTI